MNREEAEEYAKNMSYRNAVYNALQGKCIPYRKATLTKLYELLDMIELHESDENDEGMTNEEAIKNIKEHCYFANLIPRAKEALDMAITSLERSEKFRQKAEVVISQLRADRDRLEDAIEKIRSEIAEYGSIWVQYTIKGKTDKDIGDIVENAIKQVKDQVLYIIDKHTKEREEE